MVRLSLVNLYLHGFTDPRIEEYDTLTSDDKWNEVADVILANPPFMSPKGGIKPHKRFTVAATRSEVLFVDYMAEHLTATGRAAIVVPEGIIFQSGTAYKALRKLLVDTSLVAVVSLPAGVFNPYSGVKTSILILDKRLHKQLNSVLFVKVGNDGFNLGAQRRAVVNSDLPEATRLLRGWMTAPEKFEGDGVIAQAVERTRLAENGDFNLSAERYTKASIYSDDGWPMVRLGDICKAILTGPFGTALHESDYVYNGIPVINPKNIVDGAVLKDGAKNISTETRDRLQEFAVREGDIVIGRRGEMGRCAVVTSEMNGWLCGTGCFVIRLKEQCDVRFAYLQISSPKVKAHLEMQAVGVTMMNLNQGILSALEIPLPPLEVQNQIVAEIGGYQKIIDGARQVLDNYEPHIVVQPDWPIEKLGEICENLDSQREPVTKGDRAKGIYPYYGASGIVDYVEGYIFDEPLLLISEDGANLLARSTPIAFSVSGKIWVNNHAHVVRFADLATQRYVEVFINSIDVSGYVTGSAQPKLNQAALSSIKIPLPDLPTQRAIVAEIEAEQTLVNANRELIRRMEAKVKAAIDRVWGN
jgi:type I restriction enzyme M protein